MTNPISPWINLRTNEPFLAECDKDAKLIDFYNVHLEILPQPYLGNIETAKVVMLLLNPGYTTSESSVELQSSTLQKAIRENLDPAKSRLFFIEDDFDWTAGGQWWRKILKPVFEAGKWEDWQSFTEDIYKNFMAVEYFPYHSTSFNMKPDTVLPSQKYCFHLVEQAMKNNATILLMRGDKWWFSAVPKLKDYPDLVKPSSPRNAVLSEPNLKNNFNRVVGLLKP